MAALHAAVFRTLEKIEGALKSYLYHCYLLPRARVKGSSTYMVMHHCDSDMFASIIKAA